MMMRRTTVAVCLLLACVALALTSTVSAAGGSRGRVSPSSTGVAGPSKLTIDAVAVWGRCINHAVHAATAVAFNGATSTVALGDVGVAPGTSISGSYTVVSGVVNLNNAAAVACAADKKTAYNYLKGLTCPARNKLPSQDLAGKTFLSGVWCFPSMIISAATVTLDGAGDEDAVFVFQTSTTLTTATATSFILINGAQAKNVYWAIGSSATLALDSSFVGNIAAAVAITINSRATVLGRALAGAGVSFAGAGTITLPAGSGSTPTTPTSSSSTGAAGPKRGGGGRGK